MMKISKSEIKSINAYENGAFSVDDLIFTPFSKGKEILYLIVLSQGRKELHDSGYPYIQIIGKGKDNKFYDLGVHDHFICNVRVNIDSLGKNLFRVCPWDNRDKPWFISESFWSASTFEIGDHFNKDPNKVILR